MLCLVTKLSREQRLKINRLKRRCTVRALERCCTANMTVLTGSTKCQCWVVSGAVRRNVTHNAQETCARDMKGATEAFVWMSDTVWCRVGRAEEPVLWQHLCRRSFRSGGDNW